MSALSNRLAVVERAAGVNQPCPQCSISEPTPADAAPDDYIAGTCGFCGCPMNYLEASYEVPEMAARIEEYSDEELERIIWPGAACLRSV